MFTCCYDDYKKNKYGNGVSISGWTPEWFDGLKYGKVLAPKKWFYDLYHETTQLSNYCGNIKEKNEKQYIENYLKYVLCNFDYGQFKQEVGEKSILLCYEEPQFNKSLFLFKNPIEIFCHRGIVSEYIRLRYGDKIPELYNNKIVKNMWQHLKIEEYLKRVL